MNKQNVDNVSSVELAPVTPTRQGSTKSPLVALENQQSITEMTSPTRFPTSVRYDRNNAPRFETNSTRILHELIRKHAENSKYMFHPLSTFITAWTMLSIIILFYIALVVPVIISFSHLHLPPNYVVLDILIDIFYICDVVIIFRTGIIPNEKRPDIVIMDYKEVAMDYLKTWFAIDVLCSIPFAIISVFVKSALPENSLKLAKLLKISKLLRIAKLTKIGKANQYMEKIEEAYLDIIVSHPHFVTACRMLFNTILGFFVIHYFACMWWFLGKTHHNNWIRDAGVNKKPSGEQYLTSIYWVITTMTTVGYGDISPVNGSERAFGILVMVSGCTLYGLLIAKITSIVGEYEANRRMIAEKMDAIALYIHKKRIHPNLRKQILVYFRFFLKKNSIIDEGEFLSDLSARLREKVILHLVSSMVTNNPLFQVFNRHITEIYHLMQLQIYHRGQHITYKGEKSEDMLVILVGRAVILDQSKDSLQAGRGHACYPLFEVYPGATFGEKCAFGLEDHFQVTVRAIANCEIYNFPGEELMNLIGQEHVLRIRKLFRENAKFKVRLRTYHITKIDNNDMERMKRSVLSLPKDHISRSWLTGISRTRAQLKESLIDEEEAEKALHDAQRMMTSNIKKYDSEKDDNNDGKKSSMNEQRQFKTMMSVFSDDGESDDEEKKKKAELSFNTQDEDDKIVTLTKELSLVKNDVSEMKVLLNRSVEDNAQQLEAIKQLLLTSPVMKSQHSI